jgi:SAM-dependent methyltransferase
MAALTPQHPDGREGYFAALYGDSPDPYGLRTRWYEARKQALMMASLPRKRYARAYEPGCGVGETTAALAGRCDQLLASDFSARAVQLALERTREWPQVRVEHHRLPADWPRAATPFDLIVLSEIGYFFDVEEWRDVARLCRQSLAVGGTLVACHWQAGFAERRQATREVHAALAAIGLPRILRHQEDDFLLEVWEDDGRSVAQRDGIR